MSLTVAVQSKVGTKRVTVPLDSTTSTLYENVVAVFELTSESFALYRDAHMKELVENGVEMKSAGLKHGDRIYLQQLMDNLFKKEEANAYQTKSSTNSSCTGPTKIHRLPPPQQGG